MSKLSTRPDFTNTEIQDTDEFWINVDNLDTTFESQKMTGLQLKSLLTGIAGSGTNNYVSKWTPDGNTLGNSLLQDNGTTLAVGTSPTTDYKFKVHNATELYGLFVQTFKPSTFLNVGIHGTSTGSTGRNYGLIGMGAGPTATINIGVHGESGFVSTGKNIGLSGRAEGGVENYAIQLYDGTRGVGKVLTCVGPDGEASWVDNQDLSTYQPYTTATTGSVISFIVPQVYNSVASPSSSNITDSLTSAKIGLVQKIYHNHTVAPTFPAGWVKMGTATYTTSTLNVIFAEWVSSTRVEYWITKPS
jgi:hypothetical protein